MYKYRQIINLVLLMMEINLSLSLICLRWSILRNDLILTCQTDYLNLSMSFLDPNRTEQAHCLLPIPTSHCTSNHPNGKIVQDLTNNKTTFSLSEAVAVGQQQNGLWTCLLGSSNQKSNNMVTTTNYFAKDASKKDYTSIQLSAPRYIITDQPFVLKCLVPGFAAVSNLNVTFMVNDLPYALFRKSESSCEAMINEAICKESDCKCTDKGYSYVVTYRGLRHIGFVKFSCHVELFRNTELSDCVLSQVIDMVGPNITADEEIISDHSEVQVYKGDKIKLKCMVIIQTHLVQLEWKCFDASNKQIESSTNGQVKTTLLNTVLTPRDASNCSCYTYIDDKTIGFTTLQITLIERPGIIKSSDIECKKSQPTTLSCRITNMKTHTDYGFVEWTHTRNGKLIKHLVGVNNGNLALLYILTCGKPDEGNYTCKAWIRQSGTNIWMTETIMLSLSELHFNEKTIIEDIPYIVTGFIVIVFILLVFRLVRRLQETERTPASENQYYDTTIELTSIERYNSTSVEYEEIENVDTHLHHVHVEEPMNYEEIDKTDNEVHVYETGHEYLYLH